MSYLDYYQRLEYRGPNDFKLMLLIAQDKAFTPVEKACVAELMMRYEEFPERKWLPSVLKSKDVKYLSFNSVIMMLMAKADDVNLSILCKHFSNIWNELKARHHAPGGLIWKRDFSEMRVLRKGLDKSDLEWAEKYCRSLPTE